MLNFLSIEIKKLEALMKILVTPPLNEIQKSKLLAAAPEQEFIFCNQKDITERELEQTDIILGNLRSPEQLSNCKNLKWIQLNNAGTEGYCVPGILPEGALLANATGAYGLAISEHMISCLFELKKKLNLYYHNQLNHRWHFEGHVSVVEGSTVLVIGFGDIGATFGRKMKGLGCRVLGVKRRPVKKPEWLDGLYSVEDLEELLPQADIIAMSLPGNSSTYHILDKKRFGLLKRTAILINVGRGTAIDTDTLVTALNNQTIAGAALDVTDPEPLPADHPLWDCPNTIITPHVSGGFSLPETLEQIVDLFAANLKHYFAGEELENIIDLSTGYRK